MYIYVVSRVILYSSLNSTAQALFFQMTSNTFPAVFAAGLYCACAHSFQWRQKLFAPLLLPGLYCACSGFKWYKRLKMAQLVFHQFVSGFRQRRKQRPRPSCMRSLSGSKVWCLIMLDWMWINVWKPFWIQEIVAVIEEWTNFSSQWWVTLSFICPWIWLNHASAQS